MIVGLLSIFKRKDDEQENIPQDDILFQGSYDPGSPQDSLPFPERGLGMEQPDLSLQRPASISSFNQQQQATTMNKELELISAKLDTIRLILDNLDRRVANLEKIARG